MQLSISNTVEEFSFSDIKEFSSNLGIYYKHLDNYFDTCNALYDKYFNPNKFPDSQYIAERVRVFNSIRALFNSVGSWPYLKKDIAETFISLKSKLDNCQRDFSTLIELLKNLFENKSKVKNILNYLARELYNGNLVLSPIVYDLNILRTNLEANIRNFRTLSSVEEEYFDAEFISCYNNFKGSFSDNNGYLNLCIFNTENLAKAFQEVSGTFELQIEKIAILKKIDENTSKNSLTRRLNNYQQAFDQVRANIDVILRHFDKKK